MGATVREVLMEWARHNHVTLNDSIFYIRSPRGSDMVQFLALAEVASFAHVCIVAMPRARVLGTQSQSASSGWDSHSSGWRPVSTDACTFYLVDRVGGGTVRITVASDVQLDDAVYSYRPNLRWNQNVRFWVRNRQVEPWYRRLTE